MTAPPTEPAGNVQPSEPALLAVLDACEEYASLHHQLLRAGRRKNVGPAVMRPLAARLDQRRRPRSPQPPAVQRRRLAVTDMAITARDDSDGAVRLVVTGEIDMANAEQIPAAATKALARHPVRIMIDLAGVNFLDSSGLRHLLTAYRIAADNGTDLRVANAVGAPLRVLMLAGLLDILNPPGRDA